MNPDIKMIIFESYHAREIQLRPCDQYIKESPLFDRWAIDNHKHPGFTAIRISDGKILGCGGIKRTGINEGELWFLLCDEIDNYKKDAYEFVTLYGSHLIKEMKLDWVFGTVKKNNQLAIKFAESIGLKREVSSENDYAEKDYYIYSMLVSSNMTSSFSAKQKVQVIEDKIKELPDHLEGDCFPLTHLFARGLYVREIKVPKGVLITSKIHKYSHVFFLLKGKIEVLEEGGTKIYDAPKFFITPAGTKRAVYHHEDTVVVTVHATDKTDIAEIEDEIIAKDWNEIDSNREAVCLL